MTLYLRESLSFICFGVPSRHIPPYSYLYHRKGFYATLSTGQTLDSTFCAHLFHQLDQWYPAAKLSTPKSLVFAGFYNLFCLICIVTFTAKQCINQDSSYASTYLTLRLISGAFSLYSLSPDLQSHITTVRILDASSHQLNRIYAQQLARNAYCRNGWMAY